MRHLLLLLLICCATGGYAKNHFAGVDIQFVRINISVDPAVKYIKGVTTHHFGLKTRQDRFLPVLLELSSELKVQSVIHGTKTLRFDNYFSTRSMGG